MSDFDTIKQWEDCRDLIDKFALRNGFKTQLTPTRFILQGGGTCLHFCNFGELQAFIHGYNFGQGDTK